MGILNVCSDTKSDLNQNTKSDTRRAQNKPVTRQCNISKCLIYLEIKIISVYQQLDSYHHFYSVIVDYWIKTAVVMSHCHTCGATTRVSLFLSLAPLGLK